MPSRDFLARRRRTQPNRRDREEEMRHTDLPPSFDVEAEVLRERAFELLPALTMDDVNALADAGIPGLSFPEEGLLSDKMEELIRGAIDPTSSSEGGLTDIWPDTPGTPPINPNPESWPVLGEGPFPPRPNGTPPHLLDPSTPSPLLLLFDPVGEISPEQVANDIVAGAAVADQARNVAAQNTGQFRHVDVAALPPEEQARVTQALSGAGQGLSHADQSVGGDPLGAAVPPHSNLYNRALRHQSPEQAQRHVSQANNQRHALGNPGAEFPPRQQVNAPLPSSQTPAPPSTGNPISDRAIQLAQGRFQQPNGFPASAFDHVGFGQRAIADALARLTGRSQEQLRGRSGGVGYLPMNEDGRADVVNNIASMLVLNSKKNQPMMDQENDGTNSFLDRLVLSLNGGDEDGHQQKIGERDIKTLEELRDDPERTPAEKRILQRLIDANLPEKKAIDPEKRELNSAFIPGRVNPETGQVERVSEDELNIIAYILADRVVKSVSRGPRIGKNDPKGRKPKDGTDGNAALVAAELKPRGGEIELLVARLNKTEKKTTFRHEVGHLIDFRSEDMPTKTSRDGLLSVPEVKKELKEISIAYRGPIKRDEREYRLSSRELLADAFAMYMKDPERFKKKWPKTARMLRDIVNDDEILGRVITFARKDGGNGNQGSISFA